MKQFLHLVRFQMLATPFVWFMPFAVGVPQFFILFQRSDYHPDLDSVLQVQNLFMTAILGLWMLAPEMAQSRGTGNPSQFGGTEFILTRAVDRPVVYRARAACLYLLVFLIPLIACGHALTSPDLKISAGSKMEKAEVLRSVPAAREEPRTGRGAPAILLPRGNVLVEEWHFWMFALAAAIVQVILILLHPLRYRLFFFYAVFMTAIFVPLFGILFWNLRHIGHDQLMSTNERLFFLFTRHPLPFWLLTAAAIILVQLWCELRFARQEQ